MSTYYYIGCHTCKVYTPVVAVTASRGTGTHDRFNPKFIPMHSTHELEIFSEYDLDAHPISTWRPEDEGV